MGFDLIGSISNAVGIKAPTVSVPTISQVSSAIARSDIGKVGGQIARSDIGKVGQAAIRLQPGSLLGNAGVANFIGNTQLQGVTSGVYNTGRALVNPNELKQDLTNAGKAGAAIGVGYAIAGSALPGYVASKPLESAATAAIIAKNPAKAADYIGKGLSEYIEPYKPNLPTGPIADLYNQITEKPTVAQIARNPTTQDMGNVSTQSLPGAMDYFVGSNNSQNIILYIGIGVIGFIALKKFKIL